MCQATQTQKKKSLTCKCTIKISYWYREKITRKYFILIVSNDFCMTVELIISITGTGKEISDLSIYVYGNNFSKALRKWANSSRWTIKYHEILSLWLVFQRKFEVCCGSTETGITVGIHHQIIFIIQTNALNKEHCLGLWTLGLGTANQSNDRATETQRINKTKGKIENTHTKGGSKANESDKNNYTLFSVVVKILS